MEKPIEPQIYEFGISNQDLLNHPKLSDDQLLKLSLFFGSLIWIYLSWAEFLKHISSVGALIFSLIMAIVIYGLPSIIGGTIIAYSLNFILDRYLSSNSEQYKNVEKYYEAKNKYLQRLRDYNEFKRKSEMAFWRSLSGRDFELELGKIYQKLGYQVQYTPTTGDGGVDLILKKDGLTTIVQCKAHSKKIAISVARELAASLIDFRANNGIIACFEGVTKPVSDYILDKPITVITLNEIIDMHVADR